MRLDLATVLNVISTLAIVGALIFTALQVREANRARRDQASVAMIQSVQGDSWTRSLELVGKFPANASAEEIEQSPVEMRRAIYDFAVRLETVGYMVYRHLVELHTVDDLIGGVTLTFWSRARNWVEAERQRTGSAKFLEWSQWIAMRIAERHANGSDAPAYRRDLRWRE